MTRPDHHRRRPYAAQRQRPAATATLLGEDDAVATLFARFMTVLSCLIVVTGIGMLFTGASALVVVPFTVFIASALTVSSQRLRWARRVRQLHAVAATQAPH